jgi:hypothetical protein
MKNYILLLFTSLATILTAQSSDCTNAKYVCTKEPIIIEKIIGYGERNDELLFLSCGKQLNERNSIWLQFTAKNNGKLTFNIQPFKVEDDIDFVLFENRDITKKCILLKEIRCMSSGSNTPHNRNIQTNCMGSTGLRDEATDNAESIGCSGEKDNFLKPAHLLKDHHYVLMINNYSSTNGIIVNWGGDVSFGLPDNTSLSLEYINRGPEVFIQNTEYMDGKYKYHFDIEQNDNTIENSTSLSTNNTIINGFKEQSLGCKPVVYQKAIKNDKIKDAILDITASDREGALIFDYEIGNPFPNPTKEYCILPIISENFNNANITLLDIYGRKYYETNQKLTFGANNIVLPLKNTPSGIYQIFITIENSKAVKKIIKI